MAKWAIGLRLKGPNDAVINKAFNDGTILRTHLMRPTWHFVLPEDIRWLLALTAPRVHAINAFTYRLTELDNKIFKKSNDIIIKKLEGGKKATRAVLQSALEKKKIPAKGIRLAALMMYAELEGIICSGPREGKQFTYMLLDERAPGQKIFDRKEALAEFTSRYFRSRGPATIKDFASWSGLTVKEAKEGIASLSSKFIQKMINGQEYIFMPTSVPANIDKLQTTFLMPDYDEYGMSYRDRSAMFDGAKNKLTGTRSNPVFNHVIIIDGVLGGTWKPVLKDKKLAAETLLFDSKNKKKQKAVMLAVKRYNSFW